MGYDFGAMHSAAVASMCLTLGVTLWASVPVADADGLDEQKFRPCDDSMNYGVLRKSGDTFYEDGLRAQAAECYQIATRINTKDEVAFFSYGQRGPGAERPAICNGALYESHCRSQQLLGGPQQPGHHVHRGRAQRERAGIVR